SVQSMPGYPCPECLVIRPMATDAAWSSTSSRPRRPSFPQGSAAPPQADRGHACSGELGEGPGQDFRNDGGVALLNPKHGCHPCGAGGRGEDKEGPPGM